MADVSLMVDGEDGFGNAVNVMRTVRSWRRGVAAINQDNIAPVRSMPGPGCAQEEQVGKLAAALRAPIPDRVVARTAHGWPVPPGALDRCVPTPGREWKPSSWWACGPASNWGRYQATSCH